MQIALRRGEVSHRLAGMGGSDSNHPPGGHAPPAPSSLESTSVDDASGGDTQFLGGELEALATRGEKVPTLTVIQGKNIGEGFVLHESTDPQGEGLVIGRVRACDITLHDPKISRLHSRLIVEKDAGGGVRIRLIDLHSTNGTRVNDAPINEAVLHDGDKIAVGETVLRYSLQDPVDLQYQHQIKNLLTVDNLTHLLTKRTFDHQFEDALDMATAEETPIAVLMMDLDHFKAVNDTHGHLMGSHVLREVGRVIRTALGDGGVAGRYGGEEFIAYLAGVDKAAGLEAAERVRAAVEAHRFEREGVVAPVTISIGVSVFPEDGQEPERLIQRADEALYEAKGGGRNRVCATP